MRVRSFAPLVIAGVCVLSAACTSEVTGTGPAGASADPANSSDAALTGDAAVVKRAIVASSLAFDLGEESKLFVAQAVFGARAQNGGTATATGTLTQQGQTPNFQYTPDPSDRLVVVFGDGTQNEIWITDMRGNVTGGPEDYLEGDHFFRYRITQAGGQSALDIEVADDLVGGDTEATLKGTFEIEGTSYTADVHRVGTKTPDAGSGFAGSTTDEVLTGTVSGGDLAISLSETYRYNSAYSSERFLQSITQTVNNTWTEGGASYVAEGVIMKHLENLEAIEIDTDWKAEGTIEKDGTAIGELGLEVNPGVVSIYVTVDGERIELEATQIKE